MKKVEIWKNDNIVVLTYTPTENIRLTFKVEFNDRGVIVSEEREGFKHLSMPFFIWLKVSPRGIIFRTLKSYAKKVTTVKDFKLLIARILCARHFINLTTKVGKIVEYIQNDEFVTKAFMHDIPMTLLMIGEEDYDVL